MRKYIPRLLLALLAVILFYTYRFYTLPHPAPGQLLLHFLDVGQGDATIIQTPENRLILVDGGPDGKVLMSKLSQFFLSGQCRLEAVVLTHPDMDHEAGLLEALSRCEVKTVIANTAKCEALNCVSFQNSATRKAKVTAAFAGDVWQIGDLSFRVLSPPPYQDFNDSNTNNDSLVLLLTYGNYQALLTGDAGNGTFSRILSEQKSITNNQLSMVNALKVPHHGSANNFDQTVWEQLRPEVAVVSVGKNNYGQPSEKVLGEAAILGTKLLRTDQAGDITISASRDGKWAIK